GQLPQTRTSCNVCGKPHRGECRYRSGVCYYCGQPGHMARDCPRLGTPSTMTPVSQTSVEIDRPGGRGAGRGRSQGHTPTHITPLTQVPPSASRSQGRVFTVTPQEAQASNTAVTGNHLHYFNCLIKNLIKHDDVN